MPERTSVKRQQIETVLIERSIMPVFQPIKNVLTLEPVGYEALSRFPSVHARGPAGWFGDAFDVGLGTDLEHLAVELALPFLELTTPETFLALNLSPASVLLIEDYPFCDLSVCPRIVIELTEHVPVEDYSAIHRALGEIRSHGARLAADDLGAGYAGFRHLIALEPDIIKLDISLVHNIHCSRSQRALVNALLAFARDVGADVVAEGIEEAAELEVLRDLGVPWGQGYFLGVPAPAPATSVSG